MYNIFAAYYDKLTQNINYAARAAYFDGLIRANMQVNPNTILLDMGCGTGSLTVKLAHYGYDMIGMDGSQEMLSTALGKGGEHIQYICQDFQSMDLFGTVNVVICALDGLNHLTDYQALEETFRRISLFTEPGGLFLFDVNTPYKHQQILANHTFVYDLEDIFCVWQNFTQEDPLCTEMVLDFFVPQGKLYQRQQESFQERAWPDEVLQELLKRYGYDCLAVYGGDTLNPLQETDERAVYVARKK